MKERTKRIAKRILGIAFLMLIVIACVLAYANWKIPHDTESFVFDTVDSVPHQKAALVRFLSLQKALPLGELSSEARLRGQGRWQRVVLTRR